MCVNKNYFLDYCDRCGKVRLFRVGARRDLIEYKVFSSTNSEELAGLGCPEVLLQRLQSID